VGWVLACAAAACLTSCASVRPATPIAGDPLPSWNAGPAKQAIISFVQAATTPGSPSYVEPEDRIATFDQDGTLWVEHPMYTQVAYCFSRVPELVRRRPELAERQPFKTVLSGDAAAIFRLDLRDIEEILVATIEGVTVEQYAADVKQWLATAKDSRWHRKYTELTYQPMQEVIRYLRGSGFKTFIVTGGGQDFVRVYAQHTYGIPPEQVVGSAGAVKFGYDTAGRPVLTKEPRLLLNDDFAGKPEGIHLVIGKRPVAAFGNSSGDQQMLEYATMSGGTSLGMLVLHDDAVREYAYGPAKGLPNTGVGRFPQELYDLAATRGWLVISMRSDWKRIFATE